MIEVATRELSASPRHLAREPQCASRGSGGGVRRSPCAPRSDGRPMRAALAAPTAAAAPLRRDGEESSPRARSMPRRQRQTAPHARPARSSCARRRRTIPRRIADRRAIRKGETPPDRHPARARRVRLCRRAECQPSATRVGRPPPPLIIDLASCPHPLTPEEAALVFRAEDLPADPASQKRHHQRRLREARRAFEQRERAGDAAFGPFVGDHRHQHLAAFLGPALLDQAFDRDPGIAHRGGDLGEHAGAVGDGEAQVGAAAAVARIGRARAPRARRPAPRTARRCSPRAMSIRSATTALAVGPSPAPAPWNSSRPEKLPSATTALVAPVDRGQRVRRAAPGTAGRAGTAGPSVRVAVGQPDQADDVAERGGLGDVGGADAGDAGDLHRGEIDPRCRTRSRRGSPACARRRRLRCRTPGSASA